MNRCRSLFRAAADAHHSAQSEPLPGTAECTEIYFGPSRVRGTLKQPVLGVFERGSRVFTGIIPNVKSRTLQAVVSGRGSLESAVKTDG